MTENKMEIFEKKFLIPRRDGGNLHSKLYQSKVQGNKKPPIVIMCHGFTGDKNEWGRFPKTAEELTKIGYDTLIFDFSGSGENKRENILLSRQVKDLEDVYSWAVQQNYSEFATIGLSFGGITSLLADLPKRKVAVFWAPAMYMERSMSGFQRFFSKIMGIFTGRPIKQDSSGDYPPVTINRDFIKEISDLNANKYLDNFTTPSLIVQGTADEKVKVENTREAYSHMPQDENHKMIEIEGATHDFADGHLDKFIQYTIKWLKNYL